MTKNANGGWTSLLCCGLAFLACVAATGCQVDIGGQIHPSPWYTSDDVQYYAPGSEFKLPKEAAALKAYSANAGVQAAP